ncbi:MAG TPA: hypothetical protein VE967_11350 [Gemmatimonadaceae bacterium]|nr:hypothetical protein [Gemmatimonadaceae bacterium]
MRTRAWSSAGALTLALAAASVAAAQTLEQKVARASGDVVQFHFAARNGVCGDGRGTLRIDGGYWSTSYGNFSDMSTCTVGPVRALVTKDGGDVIRLQFVAGPLTPAQGATDIGAVGANEAARYFLSLASKIEGRPARSAILGIALADSADLGDDLLALARDPNRSRDLRSSALTWAARRAGPSGADRMATALDAIARDINERQAMRTSALNGLAGLEGPAGVAALMRLTERTDDAWLLGEAADALSRSNDARVRPQLRKLLENKSTPEASRVKVINALGNSDGTVRDAAAVRAAYPQFTDKERNAAVSAVANVGDRASVTWLLERAKDPAEAMNIRHNAIQRAARAGAKAPELSALYDAVIERQLREVIVDALAEDGSKPALDKLLTIAQNSSLDGNVRRRAITKLGESGDPRAKDLLQTIINR